MDTRPSALPALPADGYVLRRWELGDLAAVREASADPYIPLVTTVPVVYGDAAGIAFVERQWGRPRSGHYPFAIAREGGGCAVGHASLRLLSPDRAAIGYWVAPSARGAGAARSALRALTGWGLHELRVARLELYVEPWNTASLRTAQSAGYDREGLLRHWQRVSGELRDMVMFSALRTPR